MPQDFLFSDGPDYFMIRIRELTPSSAALLTANAARVSLSKQHTHLLPTDRHLIRFLYRHSHWTPFGHPQIGLAWRSPSRQQQLAVKHGQTPGSHAVVDADGVWYERGSVWYWLKNRHLYGEYEEAIENLLAQQTPELAEILDLPAYSPEREHPLITPLKVTDAWVADNIEKRLALGWVTVQAEAPIPIRTQAFKHKYGFVENEVSRRYVDDPPAFFYPDVWRARAEDLKQGSLPQPVKWHALVNLLARMAYQIPNGVYRLLLWLNVCPEQARFVLPQGMLTQWYWTGSLDAVFRAIDLRTDAHAQVEITTLLTQLDSIVKTQWPKTYQKRQERLSAR